MDLTPYTCRGFPGEFDRAMADVLVGGIDRAQTHSMIRLCDETEALLYGYEFSPRSIRYRVGSRPALERIASNLDGDPAAAMEWVRRNVRHPNFAGHVRPDRAMTEEELIESGVGWCNEQCRVFIAFCEVMELPARLCFLFHANGKTAHTATEVFLQQKWAFHDVTFGVRVQLPDGTCAEAREIRSRYRSLAHSLYRAPLIEYYRDQNPPIDVNRGGDFFESIGICNYLIDGVER